MRRTPLKVSLGLILRCNSLLTSGKIGTKGCLKRKMGRDFQFTSNTDSVAAYTVEVFKRKILIKSILDVQFCFFLLILMD